VWDPASFRKKRRTKGKDKNWNVFVSRDSCTGIGGLACSIDASTRRGAASCSLTLHGHGEIFEMLPMSQAVGCVSPRDLLQSM
jgi:hypothetical protein